MPQAAALVPAEKDRFRQLNVEVDREVREVLNVIASLEGTSVTKLVRRAVDDLLRQYANNRDFLDRTERLNETLKKYGD